MFRLAEIETTSWDSFNHAQSRPDVNTFHSETCFIRDQTKHVSPLCEYSLSVSQNKLEDSFQDLFYITKS